MIKNKPAFTLLKGIFLSFFWLECVSILTLLGLGLPYLAKPLEVIKVLSHGFWRQTFSTCFIVSGIFALGVAYYKGGMSRIISTYIATLILTLFSLFFVGVYFYVSYRHFPMLTIWQLSPYLEALKFNALEYKIFWTSQAITFFVFISLTSFYLFERVRPQRNVLGDAHFAKGFETYKAGFLKKQEESLIIGKKYGSPLYSNGFEHVLVFAPTGSGKTRSISIPNLLHYPYSVVCNDVKLTLFKTTSGYREKVLGHTCFCWAPAAEDRKTHRYNPLSLISDDKFQRITDIQRIAHILIPDTKKTDPIWQQASRKLFKALVLYLLDTKERPTTLGELSRLIKQEAFDTWFASLLDETTHLDAECYRNGYSYLNNHEKTRSSILETLSGYFELFDDPMVDAATSSTDFDIRKLRSEKITIYIGFTDDDMERLSPLLTLFWQQLISLLIRKIPDEKEEPYPVLFLMDEFSSLGRIERLRRSLKLLREYRVRCILMLQYIAQTYEQYTQDEAKAFTNIKTKIAFSAEDFNDAEYISKLLGMRTVRVHAGSVSQQMKGASSSQSYTYQAVPLLRPEKVMRLSDKKTLIMRTGHAPVKAEQFIWYKERDMRFLELKENKIPKLKLGKDH